MTEKLKLYQLFYIRHRQSSKKVIRTLQSPKSLAMSEFSNTSESYNWCLGDHKVTLHEQPSTPPPKSKLGLFGRLEKSLASVNLALGSGGYILSVQSQKCSKSFFEDCLCEIVNFSSEFTFLAITQSLLMGIAPKFTQVFISTYSTRRNKTNAIISNIQGLVMKNTLYYATSLS